MMGERGGRRARSGEPRPKNYRMFTSATLASGSQHGATPQFRQWTMDKLPPQVSLFLGLFSGICMSAAWCSVRPFEVVGAVSVGAATCATLLLVLRFDKALVRKARRRGDVRGALETA